MNLSDFETNKLLSKYTTLGIGGPSQYFVEVDTVEKMQQILVFCAANGLPYFILGKGSNSLFDDKGFNGLVIANRIDFMEQPEPGVFHVGAGYSFSLLGSQTARQGWSGLEFASGIPGSVGGAVYMNAGANGRETCESLVSVEFLNHKGELEKLDRKALQFGYRHSPFQKRQGAITAATFRLETSSTAREKQLEIIEYRKKTQPLKAKSAGCVFRNPQGHGAGALIDRSGLKGKTIGGAQVSTIHANFLINADNATAKDFLSLIELIKQEVKSQTGIELENEIRCIPYQAAPPI